MIGRLPRSLLVAVCALSGLALVHPSRSWASSNIPFKDPYANGTLTLCGRDHQPVTSGNILTAPFVWNAISSTAAPAGYTRAYLLVYQPIQYEDPSNWTGQQLNEDSIFSNHAHPVAQSTNADVPLLYADRSMPPRWNGLYELRMYFTTPNEPVASSPYPIAVIRVSGQNWKLLSASTTPCNAGTAISAETYTLPKSELDTPQSIVVNPQPAKGPTGTTLPGRPAVVDPAPLTTAVGRRQALSAAGARSGGDGSTWVLLPLGLVAVGAAAGGTLWLRRRRNSLSDRAA